MQEGGHGALLGVGAHLLVVKARVDADVVGVLGREERLQGHVGAAQVVQLGRAHKLRGAGRPAPGHGFLAVAEEGVAGQHLPGLHAQLVGDHRVEGALAEVSRREERAEVNGPVELGVAATLAVEVDGHARDDGHVAIRGKQAALHAVALAHEGAPGHAERAVEPGVVNHAAVGLHVKAQVLAGAGQLGHRLDLEAGRVTVGGGQLEVVGVKVCAHLERYDAGVVAAGVVAAARLHAPGLALGKVGEAGLVEPTADGGGSVDHGSACADEVQKALGCARVCHVVPPWRLVCTRQA